MSYYNVYEDKKIMCPYCDETYEPSYEDTWIGDEQVDCYTEDKQAYSQYISTNIDAYKCEKQKWRGIDDYNWDNEFMNG